MYLIRANELNFSPHRRRHFNNCCILSRRRALRFIYVIEGNLVKTGQRSRLNRFRVSNIAPAAYIKVLSRPVLFHPLSSTYLLLRRPLNLPTWQHVEGVYSRALPLEWLRRQIFDLYSEIYSLESVNIRCSQYAEDIPAAIPVWITILFPVCFCF